MAGGQALAQIAGAAQPRTESELATVWLYFASLPLDPRAGGPLLYVTNPQLEEPDALIALVRFCGGRRPAFGPDGPIPDPYEAPAPFAG